MRPLRSPCPATSCATFQGAVPLGGQAHVRAFPAVEDVDRDRPYWAVPFPKSVVAREGASTQGIPVTRSSRKAMSCRRSTRSFLIAKLPRELRPRSYPGPAIDRGSRRSNRAYRGHPRHHARTNGFVVRHGAFASGRRTWADHRFRPCQRARAAVGVMHRSEERRRGCHARDPLPLWAKRRPFGASAGRGQSAVRSSSCPSRSCSDVWEGHHQAGVFASGAVRHQVALSLRAGVDRPERGRKLRDGGGDRHRIPARLQRQRTRRPVLAGHPRRPRNYPGPNPRDLRTVPTPPENAARAPDRSAGRRVRPPPSRRRRDGRAAACALVIGNLDGVHRGHQAIVKAAVAVAKVRSSSIRAAPSFTFDPHPAAVVASLRRRCSPRSNERRSFASRPRDRTRLRAQVRSCLRLLDRGALRPRPRPRSDQGEGRLRGRQLSLRHRPRRRSGGAPEAGARVRLRRVRVRDAPRRQGAPVELLAGASGHRGGPARRPPPSRSVAGTPSEAASSRATGEVARSASRPPTSPISPSSCSPHGVYAVAVDEVNPDGAVALALGVMNIGVRPTLGGEPRRTIEVHLFDTSRDLYGTDLRVHLVARPPGRAALRRPGRARSSRSTRTPRPRGPPWRAFVVRPGRRVRLMPDGFSDV